MAITTPTTHDFVVGTFNTPSLYTLRFTPPSSSSSSSSPSETTRPSLQILAHHRAVGSHSWLALSRSKRNLYATSWNNPPTCAAYAVDSPTKIRLLGTVPTKSRSGYVCCSDTHVYSAGGATGEAYRIDPSTGGFSTSSVPAQSLDFVADQPQKDDGSTMDFGGLRHGAHSADLSPDGRLLFVADIGRNCVWAYAVSNSHDDKPLSLIEKHISPRSHDGPRHCWPHPSGSYLYVLQEHSSMVDVFSVSAETGRLKHVQGVRIIPAGLPVNEFWADEVRTSLSAGPQPKYLYASTRGLKNGRTGYVAVYKLTPEGLIDGAEIVEHGSIKAQQDTDQGGLLCIWETPTSGGWANAVEPGPTVDGVEYLAMTDSEAGYVFVLGWDGKVIKEVARVDLNTHDQKQNGEVEEEEETKVAVIGAATAVWL